MKFLTKINRNNVLLFILLIIVLSIVLYFSIENIIIRENTEKLHKQARLIEQIIDKENVVQSFFPIIEFKKIKSKDEITNDTIKTVFIQELDEENEYEPYLEYTKQIKIEDHAYFLIVRQSLLETEELLTTIILTVFGAIFVTFMGVYLATKRSTGNIWRKFNKNLAQIEKFSFMQPKEIQLTNTKIEEFDSLNRIIKKLTKKLSTDYRNLKEFTENVSHELQTPLSIISTNLDEIIQEDLPEHTLKKIYSTYQTTKKIANINQSLILLAKINNKQFESDDTIDVSKLIYSKITELKPIAHDNEIIIEIDFQSEFTIRANFYLIEVLISNVLSNAINHNIENGFIKIQLNANKVEFCNSGQNINIDDKNIFHRFVKGNPNTTGLGLSISKKICEIYSLDIVHDIKNTTHYFSLIRKL